MSEEISKEPTVTSSVFKTEVQVKDIKKKDTKVFKVELAELPNDENEAVGKLPDNVLPKQITVLKNK